MTHAGEDHGNAGFISGSDHLGITHRTARLDHCSDTYFSRVIDTVTEREERIRSHDRALHLQTGMLGLDRGDARGVHAAHLAGADADGLTVLGVDDGVGFDELGHFPGEDQVVDLLLGRCTLGDHFQVAFGDHADVAALDQQAAGDALVVPGSGTLGRPLATGQQAHIGFGSDHGAGFFADARGNDHFDELTLDDGLGGFAVQLAVEGDDAAEGRLGVGGVGQLIGLANAAFGVRQAYELAYATDTESAFGGIIAFNRELDAETAKAIVERQFVEVIIAPSVSEEARAVVAAKANVRLLACGQWSAERAAAWDYKRVTGGLLVQSRDIGMITEGDLKVVTKRAPTEQEIHDLIFAWKVAKYVKSNAIVYAKNRQTIGVGAGQMSRVNSARIAAIKAEHAGLQVQGAVMASDAFFPFRDGIDNAAKVGITAVIQPGGSMRDTEVIAAADEAGIAMVFTGMRHFRH